MQEHIDRLTEVMDDYKNKEFGTEDMGRVWPDLLQIYENRNNIPSLVDWKYYKEYKLAEFWHRDGRQYFTSLDWQDSFALSLLSALAVYH